MINDIGRERAMPTKNEIQTEINAIIRNSSDAKRKGSKLLLHHAQANCVALTGALLADVVDRVLAW